MTRIRVSLLGAMLALAASLPAATFTVSRTDDRNAVCFAADCSLREAVALANATPGADVIVFDLPMPSTVELTAPLSVTGDLTIAGPGAIHHSLRDELTIDANSHGAAFTVSGFSLRVEGLVLTGGTAGAIQHLGAGTTLTLDTVRVTGNRGSNGGGVASVYGTLIVRDSTFSNNIAAGSGGGIYHEGTQLTVTGSTFSGNVSQEDGDFGGGGIYAEDATTIINSTFSGNTSGYGGGAVNVTTISNLPVVIRNSTFTGNSALYGGGLFLSEGNVTLANSIVALNTVSGPAGWANYYEDASSFTAVNNYTGATPGLGPLQDNGGPTFTHALLAGSPAINTGSNAQALNESGQTLATDQRGAYSPRIVNGTVDIGAFEFGALPEVSFTVTRTDDRNVGCVPGDCSLREAVEAANATAGTQIVDFAPSLINQVITTTAPIAVSTDMLILGFGPELQTVDRDGSGTIFNVTGTSVTIAGLAMTGGTQGAIQHTVSLGKTLTLDTVRVYGNSGNNGGGVESHFGTLIVRDSTFSNNTAAGSGGGIYHEGTQLTVTGSTFSGNVSLEDGDYGGGGILAEDATTIINSTFSGNTSAYGGGGVNVSTISSIPVNIINSTFTANTAQFGGGLFFMEGNVTVANSLVSLNTATAIPSSSAWYQDASSFLTANNYTGSTPSLGPLQDNGGPTMTHALLCASPALNTGSNARAIGPYDQRGEGFARLIGTVDIGAFEAQTTPSCAPLLSASKTVSGTFATGTAVDYTIVLSNAGGGTQADNPTAEFTDVLPADVAVTGVTATSGTASNGGNTVVWNGTLAPAQSVTIVVTATVLAPGGTTVSNQGTASFDADLNGSNESTALTDSPAIQGLADPTTFVVPLSTAVAATKSVTGTFVPGGAVQYLVTVTNNSGGNQDDNPGDEFTDVVPAGAAVTGATATSGTVSLAGNTVTWNGAIASMASVTITIDGTVTAAGGATVSNQGTVSYDADLNGSNETNALTDDPSVAGAADPTDFVVLAPAALTATKAVSGTFVPGGTVQYTVTVTNSGGVIQPDNATDEFTDSVPAGIAVASVSATTGTASHAGNDVSWNGALAPGASVTIVISGTVAAAPGEPVANQGTAFFDADANGTNESSVLTDDPALAGPADPTSFTVLAPVSISAAKIVNGTFLTGQTVQYTVTLTNSGDVAQPDNATDELTDVLPAGVTVTAANATSGVAAIAGNTVTWNGELAPAASVTITIDATVTAATGETVSNQGSVSFDADADGTNDTSVSTDDPAQPGAADPTSFVVLDPVSLTAVKTVDGTFTPGGVVEYVVVLTNAGAVSQADNPGDEFVDVVPAGVTVTLVTATSGTAANAGNTVTWNGSIAPGASVTITIEGTIEAAGGTTVSNQGTAAFDSDGDGTNESSVLTDDPEQPGATDRTSFLVTSLPLLSATKTVSGTLLPDSSITYTITLGNSGGDQPDNPTAEFVDVVPSGIGVTGVSASSGVVTNSGNTVTWNGAIGSGASVVITIDGTVTANSGDPVENQGTVYYDENATGTNSATLLTDDPSQPGPADATSFVVAATPTQLVATKTVAGTFVTGGTIQYSIAITNLGGTAQPDNPPDELVDAVPAGLTVTSVTATSGTAAHAGNSVTWNGSVLPGDTVTVTIEALITAADRAVITNQGTVFYDAAGTGENASRIATDDPALPGGADGTSFTVSAAFVTNVPTLDPILLLALMSLLAFAAVRMLGR